MSHEDEMYSIRNIVNNIVIIFYVDRWYLDKKKKKKTPEKSFFKCFSESCFSLCGYTATSAMKNALRFRGRRE